MGRLRESSRSPESFGLAGVLSPKAKIYYESLFDLRHLGRVSDLLAAQLRKSGPDELRLRALLLFAAVHSYRVRSALESKGSKTPDKSPDKNADELGNPITIECGIDEESFAVGVSFVWPAGKAFDAQGIVERVSASSPTRGFEEVLLSVRLQADGVLLRHAPATGKTEMVALVALGGERPGPSPIEVVLIEKRIEPPKPACYVALGDLDYAKLLQQEFREKKALPSDTGDVEIRPLEHAEDGTIRVKGSEEESKAETKISGTARIADDLIRVRGTFDAPEMKTIISGSEEPEQNETMVVRGSKSDQAQDSGKKGLRKLLGKFRDLRNKADEPKAESSRWREHGEPALVAPMQSELIEERKRLREMLARVSLNERKREMEFHRQEELLQEEVRKKEILIQQANVNLATTREELSREKAKSKSTTPELADLQSKYVRSQKLVEELRRANSQLSHLAKMHTEKSAPHGGNVEELRKRLEGASQMAIVYKRETEKLQSRMEKMQNDEKTLKAELEKTKSDLEKANVLLNTAKKLRASMKPGGGGRSAA